MNQITKLLSLLFLIFSIFSLAQNYFLSERIDSLLTASNPRPFNGVVLITKNGNIQYSKTLGFKNFETEELLKADDQFEIMSNTKQITAVLILKEVDKGNIDLNSSIKKYFSHSAQTWMDSVNVHHLLNHTHGIEDMDKPLLFKPGSDFKYGNLSNILLGKILHHVTGKTYVQLSTQLFNDLKMKNTFCYSDDVRQDLVTGHINKNNVFSVVGQTFINNDNMPADGVVTNAADLAIWNTHLHRGNLLSDKMYRMMTSETTHSQHNVFGKEKMGYGYNLRIVDDKGIKYFGHTGLGDGFASLNIYIPKENISLIVLENQMAEDPELYYYYETKIKDLLLKAIKSGQHHLN